MKHNKTVKISISVIVVILSFLILGHHLSPPVLHAKETIRLKIGMAKPIQAGKGFAIVHDIFVAEVTKRVAEETDYEIDWMEAYGGTVAKDGEVLEAVQMGLLDIGYVIFLFEPAKLFLHNFGYFIPFSSPDQTEVNKITKELFTEFPIMTNIFKDQYNQKMLCVLPGSSYQLITTFPVRSIDDLKGKKIAAGGPNLITIKPLGATPVQSAIGEGYTSFKTGVYDGWLILESIMAGLKWPEVAPYVTIIDLGAPPATVLTINLDTWNNLPREVCQIIAESAQVMTYQGCKEMNADTQKIRELLKKMGAQISDLAPNERQRWANSLPNIVNKIAKDADSKGLPGSSLMNRYIQMQQESGYIFPRQWIIE